MVLSRFALDGKIAIVTGGGRGIGRAIAYSLADAGANVVVAARTMSEITQVASEIEKTGRKSLAVSTDVGNPQQIANLLDKTLASFGRVDILVNNAGHPFLTRTLELDPATWDMSMKVNLDSVFFCSRIIGEQMARQKSGNIVNISSIAALGPYPNNASYAAAKAAIVSLTMTLSVEWAQYNIRVNAIAPGFIETDDLLRVVQENPGFKEARLKVIPLKRFGKLDDITSVVVFLASDASAYITSETIVVSGGITTTVFS